MRRTIVSVVIANLLVLFVATFARAQSSDSLTSAIHVANTYRVVTDVTYLKAGNVESKLDVYQARGTTAPNPTLIWIHGGNWVGGSKSASSLTPLPFMAMGWNVVNIDYRLANVAPAPGAVEDCQCAVRWVYQHAKDYNIDTTRLVVGGNSAGGHLALLIGLAPAAAGFDTLCPGPENLKVAAVINWYGFPDLSDLLEGPNMRPAVATWLGTATNPSDLAKRLSPLTYVRSGVPPVLTVHGDMDTTSPHTHAVRLHEALGRAGTLHQLVTVPGGRHGGFSDEESLKIYAAIRAFLTKGALLR